MKRILLAAGLLAGCTSQQTSTPLSDLTKNFGPTSLEVVANGQLSILLHVNETQACPLIGENVVATFDGANMHVTRGGYDTNASGCYPIAFSFDSMPEATVAAYEATKGSELVVADASATWTVDTVKLFANDLINDPASSQIVWEDVTSISGAELAGASITSIQGNQINYQTVAGVRSVQAHSHPTASRCDGPGSCAVDLYGYRSYNGLPQ